MPVCKIGPLGYAMAHPRGLMCRTRGVRSINRLLSHNRNCKKNDDLLLRHMKGCHVSSIIPATSAAGFCSLRQNSKQQTP